MTYNFPLLSDVPLPPRPSGSTYNIPLCIWLMQQHPLVAPLVFVKPTSDMQIKVSKHVDYNGKVYLPYLSDWSQVRRGMTDTETETGSD